MSRVNQSTEEALLKMAGSLADPITVDGVTDVNGLIPLPILASGTVARITRWAETSFDDHLEVFWFQGGAETSIFEDDYPTGTVPLEIEVPITPARMAIDGTAFLYYIVTAFGMSDPSPRKQLIIDHTQAPEEMLEEADFLNLTLWGYYNCFTVPLLTSGVDIAIAPQPLALEGDQFSLHFQGYRSLNGSPGEGDVDVVPEAVETFTKTLTDDEIKKGFIQHLPFAPCIKALINNDSLTAIYTIARGGRIFGRSRAALAKIDRIITGHEKPCYSP